MQMLPFNEFVPFAPEQPGVLRKDHNEQCTGASKALRIVRKEDGSITARCFRCGQWGKWSSNYTKRERKLKRLQELFNPPDTKTSARTVLHMPKAVTFDPRQFSLHALKWLNRYEIQHSEIIAHKIGFHKKFNRVVLPVYEEEELKFYQYRKLVADNYPKYVSNKSKIWDLQGKYIQKHPEYIVIVEDLLSAIKCGRVVSAFALLGTNLSDKAELLIADYENIFIYLDNDSSQVKRIQSVLKNNLEIYGGNIRIIKHTKDPKELNTQELIKLLGVASVL